MILVGDVGATKVYLALCQRIEEGLEVVREARFEAKAFDALEDIIRRFLATDKASMACLGVPGPVNEGRSQMANLGWQIDSQALSASLCIDHIVVLNDLEVNAYAIPKLSRDQLFTLNEGKVCENGTRALIAPGTGLGEAFLTWDGLGHAPHPSEGGHTDFAPRTDDEFDLLRYLMKKYDGRVSVERVVSGMGLSNIYAFLRDVRDMQEPAWLADELAGEGDPNMVVSRTALAGKNALCEKTVDMFVSAFGAEAGNLGLTTLSVGGLYVGGGIAPHILEKLKDGDFLRAFADKGRLSRLLIEMPVHIVLDSRAALTGAAAYAETRVIGQHGVKR